MREELKKRFGGQIRFGAKPVDNEEENEDEGEEDDEEDD